MFLKLVATAAFAGMILLAYQAYQKFRQERMRELRNERRRRRQRLMWAAAKARTSEEALRVLLMESDLFEETQGRKSTTCFQRTSIRPVGGYPI